MELANFKNDFLSYLPSQKFSEDGSLYQFNGFWFLGPYLVGTQNVVSNFKPLPTDVILTSFPKTGTTWLKSILFSILYRSSKESLKLENPHNLVPTLETQLYLPNPANPDFAAIPDFDSYLTTASSSSPRIFSTHIPYQILADTLNSSPCKIVYVTREPKDTLISYWHFVNRGQELGKQPWPIEVAFESFCNGTLPFGPYYDHVLGYQKESLKRPQKVFFITYEELKDDPKTHVKRLAEFLGCPFESDENGEEELEDVVRMCSFETLSNFEPNKSSDAPSMFALPCNSFFRKGQVGDHINFLKPEMVQQIDEITQDKFQAPFVSSSHGV